MCLGSFALWTTPQRPDQPQCPRPCHQTPISCGTPAERQIFFTRSRPYKKNDQATIESKNNHLVRKYGFYYRYDTTAERAVLNRLWRLVNDRLNYLTPTKKPVGFGTDRNGRRTRLYDKPATPLERLLTANVLAPAQAADLTAYRDELNPAQIARDIAHHQAVLLKLPRTRPNSFTSPASPAPCPTSAKASTSRRPDTPPSRAFLVEAPTRFRGHLDLRHYGCQRTFPGF